MGCHSLVLTVILMAGFCQDAMGKRPAMLPDKEAVLIEEFDEIRIECNSDGAKLRFSFPETTFMVPRSQHEILPPENGTYTFLREQAQFSDAGWYACAEENVVIDNDFWTLNHTNEHISWIYVYVRNNFDRFPDTGLYPFPKTVIVVPGSTIVVPCQVTSPNVYVELWQNFKRLEGYAADFDPRIGFVLKDIVFEAGEAIIQCTTFVSRDDYIFKLSGPQPTMITAHDQDLILQEGNELKIICHSETGVSFLFPNMTAGNAYLQSIYEISMDKNGTSTFLRPSVVSEDTGWYGCAGEGIQNDIPYHSINYTKNAIDWIYVYVNSSISMTSGSMVHRETFIQLVDSLIPCRPTSPEIQIHLHRWNPPLEDFSAKFQGDIQFARIFGQVKFDLKLTAPLDNIPFDPKVGFLVRTIDGWSWSLNVKPEFYCTTDHSVDYVSKNYSIGRAVDMLSKYPRPTIMDADDSLASDDLIIRFTGEKLRMLCAAVAPDATLLRLEWTIPSTLLDDPRVNYDLTHAGSRFEDSVYLKGKQSMMTFTNMTETDGGEFMCLAQTTASTERVFATTKVSRHVLVFDKAGSQYLRLGEQVNSLTITGQKGETVKWLLDLTDCPSAKIGQYGYHDQQITNIEDRFQIKTAAKHGAPLLLFAMTNLTTIERGSYRLFFDDMDEIRQVRIDVNVQEPPTARLNSTRGLTQTGETRIDAYCWSFGSPEPNNTIAFAECPKYPSLRNCNLGYGRESYEVGEANGWKICHRQLNIRMSGILSCKACNVLGCSVATEDIKFSASEEPYFTSTNLNRTEVILDMDKPIILECYAAGDPYPNVTWFKDDVLLDDCKPRKYDNRELKIFPYFGDDGGRYTCRAENVHGSVENYMDIIFQEAAQNFNLVVGEGVLSLSMVAVVVTLSVLLVICCIIIYRQYKKASRKKLADLAFEKGALRRFNPELSIVDQAELLPYDLKWEYPRGLLKLDKTLGSGAFGIVKKAEAKSICHGEAVTTVAVKLVRSTASLNFMTALTRELKILAYLGKHPNVVNLLGACTKNVFYGELYVIVEYCRFGNLRDHLLNGRDDFVDQISVVSENVDSTRLVLDCTNTSDRGLRSSVDGGEGSLATAVHRSPDTDVRENSEASDDDCDRDHDSGEAQRFRSKYEGDYTNMDLEPICTRDLVYWSWQVSRGMEFLGQRKIVHGDLAARNILLADNGIVKVCDFGLAKALYNEAEYRDQGGNPLPIKWMAIESIKDLIFSVQSDVWSFGIVMWEIFSLGETPYPGMRQRGLVQKLIDGYRMGHPKYAAAAMYDMMTHCWNADPAKKRPSFNDMSHNFGELLDDGFRTQYLEMHAQYMEMSAEALNDGKEDYLTMSPSAIAAASSSKVEVQIGLQNSLRDVPETPV